MNDVEFEEDNNEFHVKSRRLLGEPETPAMIKGLLKTGVIKSEKQALIVLILIAATMIGAAIFVFMSRGTQNYDVYYTDKNGNRYEAEEYIDLLKSGVDPLKNEDDGR